MNPSNPNSFNSHSISETYAAGHTLAKRMRPGMVISLEGGLGSGKTTLVKGIAEAFGVPSDEVTSPTFTLVNEYEGRHWLVHVDVYRLEGGAELDYLDLDYYLEQEAIVLVEWGDRVRQVLPEQSCIIRLGITGPDSRRIEWMDGDHSELKDEN